MNAIDVFSRKSWLNFSTVVREQVGLSVKETPQELRENSQTAEHLKNIWQILQETPGYDNVKVLKVVYDLLTKQETHQLGQKVVVGLSQKIAARMIRNLLIESEKNQANSRNYTNSAPLALPPAAFR